MCWLTGAHILIGIWVLLASCLLLITTAVLLAGCRKFCYTEFNVFIIVAYLDSSETFAELQCSTAK